MTTKIKLTVPKTFEVRGDKLNVSDPCYSGDVVVADVKKGLWNAGVLHSDEGMWGTRVAELIAVHEEYPFESILSGVPRLNWAKLAGAGVDSGQMAIVDGGNFSGAPGHDEWYDRVCEITLTHEAWGTLENGVVSSSGYGDGYYDVYAALNDEGFVVAVGVVFISDEDEEDEGDAGDEGDD